MTETEKAIVTAITDLSYLGKSLTEAHARVLLTFLDRRGFQVVPHLKCSECGAPDTTGWACCSAHWPGDLS